MGASTLWHDGATTLRRLALAAAIVASIAWAFVILGWSPTWYPALRWVILAVGVVAALGIALMPRARGVLAAGHRRLRDRLDHRRTGRLLAQHGGHPAQRGHPFGRSGHPGWRRASAVPVGSPVASRGNGLTLPQGFTLPNGDQAAQRAHHPTGPAPSGDEEAAFPEAASTDRAAASVARPARWARWLPAGRDRRRWWDRPGRWPAAAGGLLNGVDARKAAYRRCSARTLPVLLGGGDHRFELGLRLPAGHRRPGHGHRRIQRDRPDADPGPVRDSTSPRERSTTTSAVVVVGGGGGFGGGAWRVDRLPCIGDRQSWVATHFTAKTVDGVTLYDLTRTPVEAPRPPAGCRRWPAAPVHHRLSRRPGPWAMMERAPAHPDARTGDLHGDQRDADTRPRPRHQ